MRNYNSVYTLFVTILSIVSINLYGNDTIVYHYAGSLVKDAYFTDSSEIKINLNEPAHITLMPQGNHICMKAIESSMLISDTLWEEVYATNLDKTSIILLKDREKGISKISICKGDNIIYFKPDKCSETPMYVMPSIFINSILFANIDKNGKVINNYSEPISGDMVKFLAQKIRYQTSSKGSEIKLNVKLLRPDGVLMTNPISSSGFSYSVTFNSTYSNNNESLEQYLGSWQSKFGKGFRMEIYNDNKLLISVSIPTKGTFKYRPILTKMSGYGYSPIPKPRGQTLDSYYNELYRRGYTGKFGDYIITGWRVIEQ